ncbi:unnamed protein product [Musa hybrid cultivar]
MERATKNSVPIQTSKKTDDVWVTPSASNPLNAKSDFSFFSSSSPALHHDKQHSLKGTQSTHDDRKGKDPMDDVDPQDVGIMLPDDEAALLSGALDCLDLSESPGQVLVALEDCDLFCGGGKMELDSDPKESIAVDSYLGNVNHQYTLASGVGTISVAHPHCEHPSRTLFVRNVDNNVEDSELRSLFEKFGEIRSLYTACKTKGFVMISYYDIRAAQSARRALQNMPLRRRNLDIHYSIPKDNPSNQETNQGILAVFNLRPSLSTEDIAQMFGAYGEIKEIWETPHKRHHKFIEFYDVRAAEAALRSLHDTEIAGMRLKIEPSSHGGTRRYSMQQLSRESEQDENIVPGGLSIANSSPGSWPQLGIPNDIPYCQQDTWRNDDITLESFAKSAANPTGLSGYRDKISSSSSSSPLQGGGSQRSHSFPYLGCAQGEMTSISGNLTSFGPPTPNTSGVRNQSGSRYPCGTSTSYMGNVQSSSWQPGATGGSFMADGHGRAQSSLDSNQHGSFMGSSHHQHGYLIPVTQDTSFVMNMTSSGGSSLSNMKNQGITVSGNVPSQGFGAATFYNAPYSGRANNDQYQLDLDKITKGEDTRTTIMIKNIPNKYTSKMILAEIDATHKGTYDFFYLPIDFKKMCNVGYAFINMLSPAHILTFYQAFSGKKWEKFNSEKIISLAYARIQGRAALVAHFQDSSLMAEAKIWHPIFLDPEGAEAGDQKVLQELLPQAGHKESVWMRREKNTSSGGSFEE